MHYTQLLNAHKGIIYLFLGWMIIKTLLMILMEQNKFTSFRSKTKIIEIVLGSLILISGAWLFTLSGNKDEGWLHAKMTIAILAIPLAIVGFRKYKIGLVASSLVLFSYVFWVATFKGFGF